MELGRAGDEEPIWRSELSALLGPEVLPWIRSVRRRAGGQLELTLGRESVHTTLELQPGAEGHGAFLQTPRLCVSQRGGGALSEPLGRELERIRHRLLAADTAHATDGLLRRLSADALPDPDERRRLQQLPDLQDPEQRTLARMCRQYARHYGEPPVVYRRRVLDTTCLSLRFSEEHLDDDACFFRISPALRADGPSVLYLRRLGFDWDRSGVVREVPIPGQLSRSLLGAGLGAFGVRPRLLSLPTMALFDRRWLAGFIRAQLPINLGSRAFYLRHAWRHLPRLRTSPQRRRWLMSHFVTLAHDLSVHALPAHLVPRELLLMLGDLIAQAWRKAPRSLHAPEPLLLFYDMDFHIYCRDAWADVERLADLPLTLLQEARLSELLSRLEHRVRSCR